MGMYSMIRIGERIHVTRVLMAFLAGGWQLVALVSNGCTPLGDHSASAMTHAAHSPRKRRKPRNNVKSQIG